MKKGAGKVAKEVVEAVIGKCTPAQVAAARKQGKVCSLVSGKPITLDWARKQVARPGAGFALDEKAGVAGPATAMALFKDRRASPPQAKEKPPSKAKPTAAKPAVKRKKSPAKQPAPKKSPAKKPAAKKPVTKKSPARKPAKKSPAGKPAKKSPAGKPAKKSPAGKPAKKPPAKKPEARESPRRPAKAGATEAQELAHMTIAQLRAFAQAKGIELTQKLKADIRQEIISALGGAGPSDIGAARPAASCFDQGANTCAEPTPLCNLATGKCVKKTKAGKPWGAAAIEKKIGATYVFDPATGLIGTSAAVAKAQAEMEALGGRGRVSPKKPSIAQVSGGVLRGKPSAKKKPRPAEKEKEAECGLDLHCPGQQACDWDRKECVEFPTDRWSLVTPEGRAIVGSQKTIQALAATLAVPPIAPGGKPAARKSPKGVRFSGLPQTAGGSAEQEETVLRIREQIRGCLRNINAGAGTS